MVVIRQPHKKVGTIGKTGIAQVTNREWIVVHVRQSDVYFGFNSPHRSLGFTLLGNLALTDSCHTPENDFK